MTKPFKIHIIFDFQSGPAGGGNQFLKTLREEFKNRDIYEENLQDAEIILFNSHHNFDKVFETKKKFREKIFIHRIAGPVCLTRGGSRDLDKIIFRFNKLVADGIIFQSNWSKEQNKKLFEISSKYESVIHNAPDNGIFNKIGKKEFNPKEKIKLIATSWSSGHRKGSEICQFLDENLDFSKYEMTFVGNYPVEFQNIKVIKPVSSEKLVEILKEHDIYIFGSKIESCSNALIEALSCDLPAIAIDGSSNSEVVKGGGELFIGKDDIIEKIEKVAKNLHYYQSKIPEFSIEKVAQKYYKFAERIYNDFKKGKYKPKYINLSTIINFYKMKFVIMKYRAINKLNTIKEKI